MDKGGPKSLLGPRSGLPSEDRIFTPTTYTRQTGISLSPSHPLLHSGPSPGYKGLMQSKTRQAACSQQTAHLGAGARTYTVVYNLYC